MNVHGSESVKQPDPINHPNSTNRTTPRLPGTAKNGSPKEIKKNNLKQWQKEVLVGLGKGGIVVGGVICGALTAVAFVGTLSIIHYAVWETANQSLSSHKSSLELLKKEKNALESDSPEENWENCMKESIESQEELIKHNYTDSNIVNQPHLYKGIPKAVQLANLRERKHQGDNDKKAGLSLEERKTDLNEKITKKEKQIKTCKNVLKFTASPHFVFGKLAKGWQALDKLKSSAE